jgi:hypothetical protein
MRVLLHQPTEALTMMCGSVTTEQLEEVRAVVEAFDEQLEAVHYFLSNYCNDGDIEVYDVPTDVAAIKAGVVAVVQRLSNDGYKLVDIQNSVPQLTNVLDRFPQVCRV